MNAYSDVTTFKRRLDMVGDTTQGWNNADLRDLLEAASRAIDDLCKRWFYCHEAPRYFDGTSSPLFCDDILSVTDIKLDEDGDGIYEKTMAPEDYVLYPLNTLPKTWIEISSGSKYRTFANNIKRGVEITGIFGYGDGVSATPYTASGGAITVADGMLTQVTASDGTLFAVGQTIKVASEQMYITDIVTNTLTVKRGVNGTTGTAHTPREAYIYDYPETIKLATVIQAMRWFKRRDSAFQDAVINDLGRIDVYKGLDPDIAQIVNGFIKRIY